MWGAGASKSQVCSCVVCLTTCFVCVCNGALSIGPLELTGVWCVCVFFCKGALRLTGVCVCVCAMIIGPDSWPWLRACCWPCYAFFFLSSGAGNVERAWSIRYRSISGVLVYLFIWLELRGRDELAAAACDGKDVGYPTRHNSPQRPSRQVSAWSKQTSCWWWWCCSYIDDDDSHIRSIATWESIK